MAKVHLDRLRKRYEGIEVKGVKYSELTKQILDTNRGNVQRSLYGQNKSKWELLSKKYRADRDIRLVLPPSNEVIPPRAVHVLKSAEKGELIRDTLRDRLTKSLRETLREFPEESYVTRRGAKAGRINPKLVDKFEQNIRKTFTNYTRRHKEFGMPKNVHEIAVTEIRSSINNIKNIYTQRMIETNSNIEVKKKWIHNKSLSKRLRRGHMQMKRKRALGFNDFFRVPLYKERKGRLVRVGETLMRYPHDPTAPAEQVISCHCDYDVIVSKRKNL